MNRVDAKMILLKIKNEYIEKEDIETVFALDQAIKDITNMDIIVDVVDERYDD